MDLLKKILRAFILVCFFSSCQNKAVKFNNELINIQQNVLKEVQGFGQKMQGINADSLPFSNLKSEAEKVSLFINNQTKVVKNLSAPDGGDSLKAAIINQLEFEHDIVEKIGKLAGSTLTENEKSKIENEFLTSGEKAAELEANIKSAQEAFSREQKFRLKN